MTVLSLISLRDAVISALRTRTSVNVEKHGGDVTDDLLKRYMQDAPCLRVAVIGVGETSQHSSGGFILPVQCAVIVVTKDRIVAGQAAVDRDVSCVALASAVVMAVQSNRFGLENVFQPKHLHARNEFSGAMDKTGVAAWQVTWTQDIVLNPTPEEAVLLTEVYINGAPIAAPADPVTAPLGDPLGYQRPLDVVAL